MNIHEVVVAVAGFPCERNGVAHRFAELVHRTAWRSIPSPLRLLCFHQSVEGATVGPADYVFRRGPDVIAGRAIPNGFAAVLAGHIHRHQVLTADLSGHPIAAPVFYPGSTHRTSAAERGETKGYMTLEFEPSADGNGSIRGWQFHPLADDRPR